MKKLIIVRHGAYAQAPDNPLNDQGKRQIELLAQEIKARHINGSAPRILASTATRAMESAQILGSILEAKVSPHEVLWSDVSRSTQIQKVLDLIGNSVTADVVIMVTHFEYAQELPEAFGRKVLGVTMFPYRQIEKGAAWVIDCEQKTIHKIPARD